MQGELRDGEKVGIEPVELKLVESGVGERHRIWAVFPRGDYMLQIREEVRRDHKADERKAAHVDVRIETPHERLIPRVFDHTGST